MIIVMVNIRDKLKYLEKYDISEEQKIELLEKLCKFINLTFDLFIKEN
jgi:hypothetical protein